MLFRHRSLRMAAHASSSSCASCYSGCRSGTSAYPRKRSRQGADRGGNSDAQQLTLPSRLCGWATLDLRVFSALGVRVSISSGAGCVRRELPYEGVDADVLHTLRGLLFRSRQQGCEALASFSSTYGAAEAHHGPQLLRTRFEGVSATDLELCSSLASSQNTLLSAHSPGSSASLHSTAGRSCGRGRAEPGGAGSGGVRRVEGTGRSVEVRWIGGMEDWEERGRLVMSAEALGRG